MTILQTPTRLQTALLAVTLMGGILLDSPVKAFSDSTPIQIGTTSQEVPQGTMLPLIFKTPLDARISHVGDPFFATLKTNFQLAPTASHPRPRLILPMGTTIRGRVSKVKKPSWFSKGGLLQLDFDHIVLPSGDLLPVHLKLSSNNGDVKAIVQPNTLPGEPQNTLTPAGRQPLSVDYGLYDDPGVGQKLKNSVSQGSQKIGSITEAGQEWGQSWGGNAGAIATTPFAMIGGTLVGGATIAKNSVKALVLPGESAIIEPGDHIMVDFGHAFTLPTE